MGVASACAADPIALGETDVVVTLSEKGRDYAEYETYALPDSLVDLCIQPESGTPTTESLSTGGAGGAAATSCASTSHSLDESVLENLATQLDALGWTRVEWDEREDADVLLLAGWQQKDLWGLDRAYCYPPSYVSGCVQPLTDEPIAIRRIDDDNVVPPILIQMVDNSESSSTNLKNIWTAVIDQQYTIGETLGTAQGGANAQAVGALGRAIATAFEQSAYLKGDD